MKQLKQLTATQRRIIDWLFKDRRIHQDLPMSWHIRVALGLHPHEVSQGLRALEQKGHVVLARSNGRTIRAIRVVP